MANTVICLVGREKSGKTGTIWAVYNLLKRRYKPSERWLRPLTEKDPLVVLMVGTIKVAIEGNGDPEGDHPRVLRSLRRFAEEGCEVVICAARPSSTVFPVEKFTSEHGYVLDLIDKKRVVGSGEEQQAADLAVAKDIVARVERLLAA
jgi:hypothetical protein